jgi:predicted nucleotidyltransferase
MQEIVRANLPAIRTLCRRHHVRSLALFGSAGREDFDPRRSDLDFVVDLEPLPPQAYADAYFELLEGLEGLLGRPVDLVERKAIQNPHLRRAIESSEVSLYDAA